MKKYSAINDEFPVEAEQSFQYFWWFTADESDVSIPVIVEVCSDGSVYYNDLLISKTSWQENDYLIGPIEEPKFETY